MDAELGETIIWSFFSVREIEDREKVAMRSAPDFIPLQEKASRQSDFVAT